MRDLPTLLEELLEAYVRESSALNDPREPQRYREWAQELVDEARAAIKQLQETA